MPVPASTIIEVREKLGSPPTSVLTDPMIERELERTLNQHNPKYVWSEFDDPTLTTVPDSEVFLVVWLAVSNLALQLAANYAETVKFSLENDELSVDMTNVLRNYMKIHDKYSTMYSESLESQTLEVYTARVRSWDTGRLTGRYRDELQ